MRVLPDSPRLSGRRSIPRSSRGVSLVELMVVVTIISMLMALAVPSYQRVQKRARAGALVNDFRVFSTVYLAYAHENGVWPPETAAGVVPAGITSQDMKTIVWTSPTPIGGHFDWEYNQIHQGVQYRAAIAITDTADAPLIVDLELYQMMDEALDDGNLSTGSFRLGENNCPLFVLEQ